jgi:UDP-apiose/xylose synthase
MKTGNKIAVFGAGGFIGSNLIRELVGKFPSARVTCVDLTDEKLLRIAGKQGYDFVLCDIRNNDEQIENLVKGSDIIIDLIAYANPHAYIQKPIDVINLNLFDNLKIVDLCADYNKHLIQFSTCEVYGKMGDSNRIFNENDSDLILGPVRNHRWVYSCAKQLLERMVHAIGLEKDLDYTIIRPFNFIGPEMDFIVKEKSESHPRVFPHFMSSLLFGKPMQLVDGGLNMRAFTYIDDAIAGILAIMENLEFANKEIFNIGSPGNEVSIKNFAALMKRIYEEQTGKTSKSEIVSVSSRQFYGSGYEDCDRRVPDVSKLMSLGWSPKYELEETVRKSIEYYVLEFGKR